MKKGNLAAMAASKAKEVQAEKHAAKMKEMQQFDNYEIAVQITKARKKNEDAFPSKDIETLVEMAIKVVAANFKRYPELEGVNDVQVQQEIVKLADRTLPVTTTGRNVEFEFYWEDKCKHQLKNCRKEDHGLSYKQAFIERHIQKLLEEHKAEAGVEELKKDLWAARYEVFCLNISQMTSHLDTSVVFRHLPNLSYLTLTYGAKHVGMEYERPLFGMKMSDAKIFAECIRSTQSLIYLSLPGNLIDDDLISILIKGLMLNKTISQIDLSHNKISNSGARKLAKYLLASKILTHLNLSDNSIHYEGSRYIAQALKVNKSLKHLNLKLNRIDDKGGAKLCTDLQNNHSQLESLSLSSNSLGHMFCESLSEFLKLNRTIKKLDISCNFIEDSNASTLKDSLESNTNIIDVDVRNNQLSPAVEREINEIVTKNLLLSKNIPYQKVPDRKSHYHFLTLFRVYLEISNGRNCRWSSTQHNSSSAAETSCRY